MVMMVYLHLLASLMANERNDPASILVPLPRKVILKEETASISRPVSEVVDPTRSDLGDEGYVLDCSQERFTITAQTKRGLFYGKQTLNQLKEFGQVPCCIIEDKPAIKMRAVMFDMARLKEKHEYYYHVIDQLAKWKINTVFLHLTDHNGCAVEFKRHPSLATKYAFTQAEMRDLIRYAEDRHVELIPEIESWGHARWITSVPEFANLAESPEKTGTLCTCNPRTWELLADIYRETAELFPSKYIHAGCDEAAFGHCEKCKDKISKNGEDALVGEHLRRVCELVKSAGKTPMIWGDVLLTRRESARHVPKDTIICHWDYKADLSAEPIEFLKGKGFEVIGCPAIVWGSREILPRTDTWDNVANFAKIVLDQKCLGMETTVWVPQRYITDTLYPALAHACELSWSGNARPRNEFMNAFARLFFGIDPATELVQALVDVHSLSIKAYSKIADVGDYARQILNTGMPDSPPMPEVADKARSIARLLRDYRSKITKHIEEYDSLILSAEIREYVEDRAVAVQKLVQSLKQAETFADQGKFSEASSELLRSAATLEQLILIDNNISSRLIKAWNRWRYSDDPKKTDGEDNLTGGFVRSAKFLGETISRLKSAADHVEKGEKFNLQAILE
ncbi:MAG: beta-N-acetylhexosaminidase [Armatimonadetes bacterium]|nr:beta-N-acetylhexosaminidase [Armatimonadota bacterium]